MYRWTDIRYSINDLRGKRRRRLAIARQSCAPNSDVTTPLLRSHSDTTQYSTDIVSRELLGTHNDVNKEYITGSPETKKTTSYMN